MMLADETGISQSYLSQVENGKRGAQKTSPELLRKLSTALDVSYIGLLIAAGYLTEEELLTFRSEHGVQDIRAEST